MAFGQSVKEANIVFDIAFHTIQAIQWGEAIGGWKALPEKDIFDLEYWELEQAKLRKEDTTQIFQGKIALVTGAASGIGLACAKALHEHGSAVVGLDINPVINRIFNQPDLVGLSGDISDNRAIKKAVEFTIRRFGGLDILINNAGIFPRSQSIEDMEAETWNRSMEINLSSHQRLLKICIPYLKQGIDPAVIFIASKNVPAPGPGASAYSVAKAGLTQLARVAALELAADGIRVNIIHPDAVFDTGIWTEKVLEERARHYGLSVAEYKTKNLLKTEVTSKDVAALVCCMAGPAFAKTTGAQVPIDGGNERVI
jgi:NAD(P)-dependent dehydrogenase (short-subunit alcohol dehydrogenase family)